MTGKKYYLSSPTKKETFAILNFEFKRKRNVGIFKHSRYSTSKTLTSILTIILQWFQFLKKRDFWSLSYRVCAVIFLCVYRVLYGRNMDCQAMKTGKWLFQEQKG